MCIPFRIEVNDERMSLTLVEFFKRCLMNAPYEVLKRQISMNILGNILKPTKVMKVLLSIKARVLLFKIFEGEKKFGFRKLYFKNLDV